MCVRTAEPMLEAQIHLSSAAEGWKIQSESLTHIPPLAGDGGRPGWRRQPLRCLRLAWEGVAPARRFDSTCSCSGPARRQPSLSQRLPVLKALARRAPLWAWRWLAPASRQLHLPPSSARPRARAGQCCAAPSSGVRRREKRRKKK